MDRRDALKKIGVGGATLVGASTIISRPAFAYSAPTVDDPSINVNPSGSAGLSITVTGGSGSCLGSAIDQGNVSYLMSVNATSAASMVVIENGGSFTNYAVPGASQAIVPYAGTSSPSFFQISNGASGDVPDGTQVVVVVTTVWQCTYQGQPGSPVTGTGTATVTRTLSAGGVWS